MGLENWNLKPEELEDGHQTVPTNLGLSFEGSNLF